MEVHHKHHLPKNWKEYLTEFIMLFAAVTLGFFAENYREHQVVKHKMEENYQALLQDLRQDSTRMKELQLNSVEERRGLLRLLNVLYKYHDGKLNWEQTRDTIANIESYPSYVTFFMNNTTFKNMQSSGMLSYLNNKELRQNLSYYYEVLFKKLSDNNALYDQVGHKYYDEYLPVIEPTLNRKGDSLIGGPDQLDEPYRTTEANRNFVLHMPVSKTILSNPITLFHVEAFYQRFCFYTYLIQTMQAQNNKLIEQMSDKE